MVTMAKMRKAQVNRLQWEREELEARIERLRSAFERQLEAHNYAEVLKIARDALAVMKD